MIKYIKNISKEEIIVYLGCIITILLAQFIKYGWIFIIFNILFFILSSLFIIKKANIKEFRKNFSNFSKIKFSKIENLGVLVIFSLFGIGTIVGLYDIYSFYKNPITKKYDTKEEYEQDKKLKKLESERDKKLKQLGI